MKFNPFENHHLYWGSILLIFSIITKIKYGIIIGSFIVLDDLVQHIFNVNTPLHLLNNWLGRIKIYKNFVNAFNNFVKRIFIK